MEPLTSGLRIQRFINTTKEKALHRAVGNTGRQLISSTKKALKDRDPREHAIYLLYPNFMGLSANAIKVGGVDLGKVIGNPSLPVGHAATILVDKNGKATYYEYGRYTKGPVFGHIRPTSKGGNWRRIPLALPYRKTDNDSTYMARILGTLPDTHTGKYLAITIPDIDTLKATEWINSQANDKNRKEYGITNTCATNACKAALGFRRSSLLNVSNKNNHKGYSVGSNIWSFVPGSTDTYAQVARVFGSNVYVMDPLKKRFGGLLKKSL